MATARETRAGLILDWLAKAPRSLPQIEARLHKVLRPVEKVTQTAEQVDRLASVKPGGKEELPEVQVKEPGLGAVLFGGTQAFLEAAVSRYLIGLAALLTFDATGRVVTIVLVFPVLDTRKGYILTPLVMGRQFTLNAVMLFVALTFWWWAWGIPGALLAVPLMAIFKIFCERIEALAPVAKLLEE